jgi:thymidylate synthase (FAD)
MYDLMDLVPEKKINCLDKGYVALVDVMPRIAPEGQTADYAIVQAARTSYGDGTKAINEDIGLIRYLLRHNHTTPIEMIEFKFLIRMPIFVCRQWIRHRTANVNEYSGRYSVMKDDFYYPEPTNVRQQSKTNKQGGDQPIDFTDAQNFIGKINQICEDAYSAYEDAMSKGVSREQARMFLPVTNYTELYWKIDLHNLLHFLSLRCDSHAQQEIRVFGEAILKLITPIVPITIQAWNDYHVMRGAMKLTRLEVEAIKKTLSGLKVSLIDTNNKREQEEWIEKLTQLGMIVG